MPEAWKQWEGQIVNSRFVLRQYLGGSQRSAVFLTERQNATFDKAAIKLILAEETTKEVYLTGWHDVAQLCHPYLLRLYHYGQCKLDGLDLLYTVSEFAEEDLSQVMPTRALNPLEAREVLLQIADALSFLHAADFVHGSVHPSNVLAVGDDIKLASDSVCPLARAADAPLAPTSYDAPELSAAGGARAHRTAATDIYSLGATVVEALTQRIPCDGAPPARLPIPFDEITEKALHPDPNLRCTAADILRRLTARSEPQKLASTAVASSSVPTAASAPASPVTSQPPITSPNMSRVAGSPLPGATPQATPAPAPRRPAPATLHEPVPVATGRPRRPQITSEYLSSYNPPPGHKRPETLPISPVAPPISRNTRRPRVLLPVTAVAVLLVLLLSVPKFIRRSGTPNSPDAAQSASAAPQPPSPKSARPSTSATRRPAEQVAPKSKAENTALRPSSSAAPSTPVQRLSKPSTPAAADLAGNPSSTETSLAAARSNASAAPASNRGVTQKFLPDVAQKALNTIHGTVRVGVIVNVLPSGSVQAADLMNPSGSDFFNKASLQAARRWQFERADSSPARQWLLHFEFTPSTIRAQAQRKQ